ncbi:MAG: hypothetical protein R3Y64_06990 [Peptostreptococcaceae bacterium]
MGKLYFKDGSLMYDGDLKNGKPHGQGKMIYKYDTFNEEYIGEFRDGKKHGYGKEYCDLFHDYLAYEGEFQEDKRHGNGKEYCMFMGSLEYEGEYINNNRDGKGETFYTSGSIREKGTFKGLELEDGQKFDSDGNLI